MSSFQSIWISQVTLKLLFHIDSHFRWLEDPIEKDQPRELDPRDAAVLRFASSLLKRTLSESFVGVPLTDGCVSSTGVSAEESSIQSYQQKRNKMILNARSLSLELAKHKHRLAAQLVSVCQCLVTVVSPMFWMHVSSFWLKMK